MKLSSISLFSLLSGSGYAILNINVTRGGYNHHWNWVIGISTENRVIFLGWGWGGVTPDLQSPYFPYFYTIL
jgi:hypothetical protein